MSLAGAKQIIREVLKEKKLIYMRLAYTDAISVFEIEWSDNDDDEWKQEFKGIRHKIFSIDKDIGKQLQMNRSARADIAQIIKGEEKVEFEREKERDMIFKEIKAMRSDTEKFKDKLKSFEKTPAYLQKLQLMSEALEEKMSEFKESQMSVFDQIADDEEQLEKDLQLFAERLPYYENARFENGEQKKGIFQISEEGGEEEDEMDEEYTRGMRRDKQKGNINADKENEYEDRNIEDESSVLEEQMELLKARIDTLEKKIVQNGGKNQGWPNQDQQDFLKIRVRHKNQITKQVKEAEKAFLNDCLSVLGMYQETAIRDHIDKFNRYIGLEEEKKEYMNAYKDLKERRRQMEIKQLRQEEDRTKLKKQTDEERNKMLEKERIRQKEEIRLWKLQKEAKKEVKEESEKMMSEEERADREKLRRAQLEEQKKLVEEYKQYKEYDKLRAKEREEYEKSIQKRMVTDSDKERIKQKEEEMIKKKQETLFRKTMQKQQLEMKKQKHEEIKAHKYAYLPSKVTEKTTSAIMKEGEKADISKQADRFGGSAQTFGGAPVRLTGRAIPTWRAGM